MAYLIKQNGVVHQVQDLTLEKMQAMVGGYIQILYSNDDRNLFICDEDGKIYNKPINVTATRFAIACNAIMDSDYLVGDVIMAASDEVE